MAETILVVDDNDDIAVITTSFLKAQGYTVINASDGKRALELVAQQQPDCILLDVMMPELSGLEVLTRLREDAATAAIPVILVTARDRDEEVLSGYKEGADYYITKPFSSQELLYGLRMVLGERTASTQSRSSA